MKFKSFSLLIVLIPFYLHSVVVDHKSSFPYIAGDTFRAFCSHVLDHTGSFDPLTVKAGDVVFVQIDLLDQFFKNLHPLISEPYILLTHNCDDQSDDPVPAGFKHYLDDPKLGAWFTQNIDTQHPKLHALPIGLANHYYLWGNTATYDQFRACCKDRQRDKLLYMNFHIWTYPSERNVVYNMFAGKPFCTVRADVSLDVYLDDVTHHKFVVSPRGHGLDCHRTWEALLMGSYPVVKTSTLDALYKDLPVVIINDWSEVTEEFLNQKYEEMKVKKYNFDALFAPYWFEEIRKMQSIIRTNYVVRVSSLCNAKQINDRGQQLINHLKSSIIHANNKISKLTEPVLQLQGFSSAKVRHLLNNICSMPGTSYLEIGVWKGSTFVSALYGNEASVSNAIAIDNWSEFNWSGNEKTLFTNNVHDFLKTGNYAFYDADSFTFDAASYIKTPVNVYFYDGNHSVESQCKAFTYYNNVLDDVFIAIVDDWNFKEVPQGTRQAFEALHYNVLYEQVLPAYKVGDPDEWWNGFYVAVISKH